MKARVHRIEFSQNNNDHAQGRKGGTKEDGDIQAQADHLNAGAECPVHKIPIFFFFFSFFPVFVSAAVVKIGFV
jgi:hypothetical protein